MRYQLLLRLTVLPVLLLRLLVLLLRLMVLPVLLLRLLVLLLPVLVGLLVLPVMWLTGGRLRVGRTSLRTLLRIARRALRLGWLHRAGALSVGRGSLAAWVAAAPSTLSTSLAHA